MLSLRKLYFNNWRRILAISASFTLLLFLYSFQLNSLTNGYSSIEFKYASSTKYISTIFKDNVFLPIKLINYGITELANINYPIRLTSSILMVIFIGCFYLLMHRWYTRRIAILTSILLATSSWTLTIGRQALPYVLYFIWIPLLALMYWSISKQKNTFLVYLWALSFSLSLYIPGLLWFVAILSIIQKQRFKNIISSVSNWNFVISLFLFVILIIPFIYSLITNPTIAISNLGIPSTIAQITNFPLNLISQVSRVFIYSSGNAVFGLGHLPYLDVASSILFIIGLYRLRFSSSRKMMAWSSLITVGWLIGVGLGTVNAIIFLPLIYIFIGSGLSFILVQWFKVFPKNPIARTLAASAVSSLVLLISYYHLSRYFIAWPLAPETKAVFSITNDKIE